MPIEFRCPVCSTMLRTPDSAVGKNAKCPKCGALTPVPGPGQAPLEPQATQPFSLEGTPSDASEPPPPKPSPPPADNPFADFGLPAGAPAGPLDPLNPYAAPQTAASPFGAQAGYESTELRHTLIEFGEVFSKSWRTCMDNLGTCLLCGLVLFGVMIGVNFVSQILQVAGGASGELAIMIIMQLIGMVIGIVVNSWVQIALFGFAIRLCRYQRGDVGDLFTVGRFLVRSIGFQLLYSLIIFGVLVVCVIPIAVTIGVLGGERAFEDAPFIVIPVIVLVGGGGLLALIWINFRLFLTLPFIVDRDLGVFDGMRQSDLFMRGNKLTTFLVVLVAGMVGMLIAICTCCFGFLFAYPYGAVVASTVYLMATGQPMGIAQSKP